jgi:pheromone a factor receptor
MKRRAQFSEFLSSNNSLSINRYFRLMALATLELLCTTPISAYGIYINIANNPLQPWKGFADAHFDYSHIGQYPSVIWRLNRLTVVSTELTRWSLVFCAFSFFAFFGFADEARKNYRKAFWAIAQRFGFHPSVSSGISKYALSYLLAMFSHLAFSSVRAPPRPLQMMSSIGSLPAYSPAAPKFLSTSTLDIKAEKHWSDSPVLDDCSLPDTPTSISGPAHVSTPHAL